MKYSSEKKNAIIAYILEKISSGCDSLSNVVADNFGISTNTVHSYLAELQRSGIIERHRRGEYSLAREERSYTFKRSEGELEDDTAAYNICLADLLADSSENIKHIWIYALSEMVNNVIDHSGAEEMRITVSRTYLSTSVTVTDNGVGIFDKIRNYFDLPGLDEAICELFKGKLTTDSVNHSGEGIFFTSRMMDSFFISSNRKIFTTSKYNNDTISSLDSPDIGTSVYMELSNSTARTAREVFDLYSSVDGGFKTTNIPMRHIFDTAPVSRSQAKRISNRLEAFEEVILDFEGIGWMGQGFAHQLFVVYKNANPNIKITPINMNESVRNMYNHVMG